MEEYNLTRDPYNLVIAGVGGQGNVLASKILANVLVRRGLNVTIGETFGATQRGGSVMSHLRISRTGSWSLLMPKGRADTIVGLEPIEALRVLAQYGNPEVLVITNNRPVHPVGVICGEDEYPSPDEIETWLKTFSRRHWLLPATDEATRLGSAILTNIVLIGALAATGVLPIDRETFSDVIASMMPDKAGMNLQAFDLGRQMIG